MRKVCQIQMLQFTLLDFGSAVKKESVKAADGFCKGHVSGFAAQLSV